jgi:hypothetical protein
MLGNVILNDGFVVEPDEKIVSYLKSSDSMETLGEAVKGKAWEQTIAKQAFGGLPLTFEEAETKLHDLELAVRTEFAIPSARPGGARSKGTGYKLHPTFKSYKSTIKGAYEHGVELLTADGMPRSRGDVAEDIKIAKTVEKTEGEKLTTATNTWIAIYDKCVLSDPAVIDAINTIVNRLRADGHIN